MSFWVGTNFWAELIREINEYRTISTEVRRSELVKRFPGKFLVRKNGCLRGSWSGDTYRRKLTAAGFLEDTGRAGCYRIVKRIPSDLTKTLCEQLAYGKKGK